MALVTLSFSSICGSDSGYFRPRTEPLFARLRYEHIESGASSFWQTLWKSPLQSGKPTYASKLLFRFMYGLGPRMVELYYDIYTMINVELMVFAWMMSQEWRISCWLCQARRVLCGVDWWLWSFDLWILAFQGQRTIAPTLWAHCRWAKNCSQDSWVQVCSV